MWIGSLIWLQMVVPAMSSPSMGICCACGDGLRWARYRIRPAPVPAIRVAGRDRPGFPGFPRTRLRLPVTRFRAVAPGDNQSVPFVGGCDPDVGSCLHRGIGKRHDMSHSRMQRDGVRLPVELDGMPESVRRVGSGSGEAVCGSGLPARHGSSGRRGGFHADGMDTGSSLCVNGPPASIW